MNASPVVELFFFQFRCCFRFDNSDQCRKNNHQKVNRSPVSWYSHAKLFFKSNIEQARNNFATSKLISSLGNTQLRRELAVRGMVDRLCQMSFTIKLENSSDRLREEITSMRRCSNDASILCRNAWRGNWSSAQI